jgi:hypothetical protein
MRKFAPVVACILVLAAAAGGWAAEVDMSRFPFFPSLLNTVTGKPVASTEFEDPTVCQGCHPEIYKQWKGSMHSNAIDDPVFTALWKLGVEETDGVVEQLCAGCHTGIGTVAGEVTLNRETGKFEMSDIAREGVQCDLCHTIQSSTRHLTPTLEPFNASIIIDPGETKRGPYRDSVSPYHETEYSDLHTRSEFCANCHNVFHPTSYFPIERTYDEWKNSVYAQAGIQCQDCHMMPVDLAIETAKTMKKQKNPGRPCIMGPEREQMYTHEFVGGNAVMTELLGSRNHGALSVKRLQNAASLELQLPEGRPENGLARIKVKVRNETAGHNLPTSLTEVRQMWLEVKATDSGGEVLYHNGAVDAAGAVDPEAVMFNAVAMDRNGEHTVKPWEIVRFESVSTIQPKGSATVPYAFVIPENIQWPVKVDVTLHYRSFDQALADMLLGEDAPRVPVIDMVSASGTIKSGVPAPVNLERH